MPYVKLEEYKFRTTLNHVALNEKLRLSATKAAFDELSKIKLQHAAIENAIISV